MNNNNRANPWKEIPLSAYENHMQLDSVRQLQAMNTMMNRQFALGVAETVMILGIAGGNGLEHAKKYPFRKIYGVDINDSYLHACEDRYPELRGKLDCICTDLMSAETTLPCADLLIANLLIEYIGYRRFREIVLQVHPLHVSCIIQINTQDGFISDSPYLPVLHRLEEVHHQMQENELNTTMQTIGYSLIAQTEQTLPNGKKLLQMDYIHSENNK